MCRDYDGCAAVSSTYCARAECEHDACDNGTNCSLYNIPFFSLLLFDLDLINHHLITDGKFL
jgi:hypothetical protein